MLNKKFILCCSVVLLFGFGISSCIGGSNANNDSTTDDTTENSLQKPTAKPKPASKPATALTAPVSREPHSKEVHLANLQQLTFGGQNAEAYFSKDGKSLIFQTKRPPYECDQIFTMDIDGKNLKLVSTGTGRTTCAYYYYNDEDRVLFSSTHHADTACPPTPSHSQGYVWPIYESYDIYSAKTDGTDLKQLTVGGAYDAEATFSPDGSKIVFSSTRDGDLDIYTMNPDGSDVKRLTTTPGYDGGPFYSPDGTKIVYRAHHPEGESLKAYQDLLAKGLVRPSQMELYVMDADGSNQRKITALGKAAFCPFFHPDGKRILFASNHQGSPFEFDIFMVNIDGTGLKQITFTKSFDGFPMFSPDGKKLVFASNRHNSVARETNVFIADWVE